MTQEPPDVTSPEPELAAGADELVRPELEPEPEPEPADLDVLEDEPLEDAPSDLPVLAELAPDLLLADLLLADLLLDLVCAD